MTMLLRGLLAVVGVIVIWLGLNVSLGGIATLGWQGATNFFTITDAQTFAVQDNHVRFIAGVWTGVGVFLLAGAVMPRRLAPVLKAMMALVFLGGLARLTVVDPALLTSAQIAPSLFAELLLFPLLGWWIHKTNWNPEDG